MSADQNGSQALGTGAVSRWRSDMDMDMDIDVYSAAVGSEFWGSPRA
jgi:hypothetical protein